MKATTMVRRDPQAEAASWLIVRVGNALLDLLSAVSSVERRKVLEVAAVDALGMTVLTCDRCRVTTTLVGLARHLNLTEAEYSTTAAALEDGPSAALHALNDLRMASDAEQLQLAYSRGRGLQ